MSAIAISSIVFVVALGAAALGIFASRVLPEHHLAKESKEIVHLGIGAIITLTALVIFASFGLFAPRNGTVYAVIFLSALSLSTAIFLILELDQPFDGAIRISDAALRTVIQELAR